MTWSITTTSQTRTNKLALVTFLLALVVIMLGAYTRLTDAGLSCPDWPHCYGYIMAPHTTTQLEGAAQLYPSAPVNVRKAWTEMTHRYFAGTEGILILALSIALLRKTKNSKSIIMVSALLALLTLQVMLGMLTVTEKLKPVIVLAHLLTGLSILSVLWWTYLGLRTRIKTTSTPISAHLLPWCWLAVLIVIGQITLGGWVSTHYAGLACVDFPYCNGKLIPAMQWNNLQGDLITIHMLHRIGAMITAIYIGLFALFLTKIPALRSLAILILVLITLQITLGVLNIMWLRPVWIALIHHLVAILLLLTVITTLVQTSMLGNHHGN